MAIKNIEVVLENGHKLIMEDARNCKFVGFEPADMICIMFLTDDADTYIDENGKEIAGWNCNNSEYYLAADAELATIAFMTRMCQSDGGFKASIYSKPLDYWLEKV